MTVNRRMLLTTRPSDRVSLENFTVDEADVPEPAEGEALIKTCLLYTSPSPRDGLLSRMPSSA